MTRGRSTSAAGSSEAADAGSRISGRTPRVLLAALAVAASAAGGWAFLSPGPAESTAAQSPAVVQSLSVRIHRELPHDTAAYTQGLLWWDGKLYESTGQYGRSDLRRLDPRTGAVEQELDISPAYFGEGLARVDDRLIMLTWKAQRAFVFGLEHFDEQRTFRYEGEGWGLCNDGSRLVMSNGSNRLTFRDLRTFEVLGDVAVTLRGFPLTQINELECVGDAVYANVYQTDFLVRIEPESGRVTHYIEASGLLTREEARGVDVLNGIAFDPGAETFYITGKLWPKMFEVTFE
jgi:glutaminyl-peptide cyclotransferase